MGKYVKKTDNPKMGRPLKEIDQKQFENLCRLQCTITEICDWFEIDDKTLNDWCRRTYEDRTFSEIFSQKRGQGKISLRRTQWQLAEKSVPMAIWLGKQYLDQREPEMEIEHNVGKVDSSFIEALNNSAKEVWKDEKES